MKYIYPTLELEIYKSRLKIKDMAKHLGISDKALRNKLKGITSFTWPEACELQKYFFPRIGKDYLFEQSKQPA